MSIIIYINHNIAGMKTKIKGKFTRGIPAQLPSARCSLVLAAMNAWSDVGCIVDCLPAREQLIQALISASVSKICAWRKTESLKSHYLESDQSVSRKKQWKNRNPRESVFVISSGQERTRQTGSATNHLREVQIDWKIIPSLAERLKRLLRYEALHVITDFSWIPLRLFTTSCTGRRDI